MFVVDLRQNVLKVDQGKIKFCIAEMIESANNSIKQVMVAEGVNKCGEEEPMVFNGTHDAEMEELASEIPICVMTDEMIENQLWLLWKGSYLYLI